VKLFTAIVRNKLATYQPDIYKMQFVVSDIKINFCWKQLKKVRRDSASKIFKIALEYFDRNLLIESFTGKVKNVFWPRKK
jgi:hypothetical protein